MRKIILKWVLAGTTIAVITGAYGVYRYREQQMDRLYASAGSPQAFEGTTQAQAAVRKLGTYKGSRSKQMLLSIAMGRTPFR